MFGLNGIQFEKQRFTANSLPDETSKTLKLKTTPINCFSYPEIDAGGYLIKVKIIRFVGNGRHNHKFHSAYSHTQLLTEINVGGN